MDLMNLIVPRQELNTGTVLNLDNEQCIISSVRGKGASSIVYEATLNNRRIILKELYPTFMGILRATDSSLIIPEKQKDKFQNSKMALKMAFDLQLQFFNDFPNHIVEPQKLYEYNNTLYIVMHLSNGSSYDDVKTTDILAILEVAKSLSAAIGFYHTKGYLNLDIKPENLFIFPETNQLIQLFDFDTVATKEDVMQGRFSYSHGYAAPEVRGSRNGNAQLSDIDERADIFSIGVVIFEKVMGRIPDYSDHREGKIWDLSANPYLKNTVPQLQTGIMELFRKTIAREKNDRYLSVAELIKDLDKLIESASIKVFLKSQNISPCTAKNIYISRESICDNIYNNLNLYHILYLYTIRGNGKSETAREYAETYADKYNFIQSIFYSQNLKKTIANLDFVGLKQEDKIAHTDEDIDRLYSYKLDLLGNTDIYTSNTLLIIDNYDYDSNPESEEYKQNVKVLADLRKLHIHIIFTTRINPTDKAHCFKLPDMSKQELEELFFKINPVQKDDSDRKRLVDEIIEASYNHTMTVKLVALQSKKYKKSLEEYLSKLKKNGINSHIQGRITNEKDDESVTMSAVYDHIKALFDFDDLNDKEKYVMVNACLLPLEGLDTVTFSDFIDLDNFDDSSSDCIDESIEDLVNSGWINYTDSEETKIVLHPLICDVVKNELKPELTGDKCRKFYISFLDLIQEWGNEKFNGEKFKKIEDKIHMIFSGIICFDQAKKIKSIINYITCHNDYSSIENHAILKQDNCLLLYFGIDDSYSIKAGITDIQKYAFENCCSLKMVYIPYGVKNIGIGAFERCTELNYIIIPDSISEIGECTFSGCSSLENILLPENVKKIYSSAFNNCTSLKSITLPDKVEKIRDNAFANCTSLLNVKLPFNLMEIGYSAFNNCTSLESITLPDKVEKIRDNAFANCTSLLNVKLPFNLMEIGYSTFNNCTSLKSITLPDKVEKIGNYSFANCTSLLNVKLPFNLIEIGYSAFESCTSLKSITLPDKVEKIRDNAFANCTSLSDVKLPCHLIQIGDTAFTNCYNLTSVEFPNTLKYIGIQAFSHCKALHSICFPEDVLDIGFGAFECCSSVEKINLPDKFIHVKNLIFTHNTSLEQIEEVRMLIFEYKKDYLRFSMVQSVFQKNYHHYGILVLEGDKKTPKNNKPPKDVKYRKKIKMPKQKRVKKDVSSEKKTVDDIKFIWYEHSNLIQLVTDVINKKTDNNICKTSKQFTFYDFIEEDKERQGLFTKENTIMKMECDLYDGTCSLVEYKDKKVVNCVISSFTLTCICMEAFENCICMESLFLPDSIESIEDYAFKNCVSLKELHLPERLSGLGSNVFRDCISLTEIVIPEKVIYLSNESLLSPPYLSKAIILNSELNLTGSLLGYYLTQNELYKKIDNLTICGYKSSTAEQYARENGFTFIPVDKS